MKPKNSEYLVILRFFGCIKEQQMNGTNQHHPRSRDFRNFNGAYSGFGMWFFRSFFMSREILFEICKKREMPLEPIVISFLCFFCRKIDLLRTRKKFAELAKIFNYITTGENTRHALWFMIICVKRNARTFFKIFDFFYLEYNRYRYKIPFFLYSLRNGKE